MTINVQTPQGVVTPATSQQLAQLRTFLGVPSAAELTSAVSSVSATVLAQVPTIAAQALPAAASDQDAQAGTDDTKFMTASKVAAAIAARAGSGAPVTSPAGTTITLDSTLRQYEPLTVSGATTIATTGGTLGAAAAIAVVANGVNIPTVTGADEWGTSFGFLNTNLIPNRLDVWHDGIARRYSWSQALVPAPVSLPDTTAPSFVSAAIANATRTKITLTYNEALLSTLTGSITVGGPQRTVSSQTVVGSTVEIVVNTAYAYGDVVTVTVPAGCVKDLASNNASGLTAQAVTNNIAAPDVVAPTFVSAVVGSSTPNTIVITYSEALSSTLTGSITVGGASRTVSSQTVVGSTVEVVVNTAYANGDTITVTVPTNCVLDAAGNAAAALTAQAVTNNVALSDSDADVAAWLTRVTAAGGTVSSTEQTAIHDFFVAAKAASSGYYSTLRRLNVPVGNYAASLVPQINTLGAANDGGSTGYSSADYDAATGWTTNGSSKYINTGYSPNTATGGMSVYLRTAQASDTNARIVIGGSNSTETYRIVGNRDATGATSAGAVSGSWGGSGVAASTTGGMIAGFYQVSRTSATALTLYRNGASIATNNTSVTPTAATNPVSVLSGAIDGGSHVGYLASGSRVAAEAVDTGMSGAQAAEFYTHMQALQTALSRQV